MKSLKIASALITTTLIGGCSTLTGEGTSQNLAIFTYKSDNSMLDGARCQMTNDEGTWTVVTPASAMVHRSNKDLVIHCTKDGYSNGYANVVSDTKANMWGNIIFGGGIGAIIDHNNGSAYVYPNTVNIIMGQSKIIKATSENTTPPSN